MNYIRRMIALAALMLAAACLVSEEPLLDARTGKATPLEAGRYEVCQFEMDDAAEDDVDCSVMRIGRDDTGLYRMEIESDPDDVTFMRFRRIARDAYLIQVNGDDDDDYFYFVGEPDGEAFVMTLIYCEHLPESLRERYVARDEMAIEEDGLICVATTRRAAIAAAKAYLGDDAPAERATNVYRRLPDNVEAQ